MRFVLLRLGRLVTVIFAVTLLSFLLLSLLPGDPTLVLLGPAAGNAHAKAELTRQLGLDHPLPIRYLTWLSHAARGDLGRSYFTHQTVTGAILERLPLTMELMGFAWLIALGLAVPSALLAAARENGIADRLTRTSSFALLGLPPFILGIVLIYLFSVRWHVFPASGVTPWFHVGSGTIATPRSLLLPAITLAAGQFAVFSRVLRADLLTTLRSDFIIMARSKGISPARVMMRHALRPSSFSLMTLAVLSLGALIGGSVIVENIFALPGMGRLIVTSIFKRDYLMVQGTVVILSVAFVILTTLLEVLYVVADPRVRHAAVA